MQGHFPFGEMWYDSGATKWKFTTHERDSESGNDYAMARYDVSRLGRFSSPDPMAGSTISPQSLNRYSYVANDPINYHDPSGQFLTALTLFLDRMDFPNAWENWNEFDLLELQFRVPKWTPQPADVGSKILGPDGSVIADLGSADRSWGTMSWVDAGSALFAFSVNLGDSFKPWEMRKRVVDLLRQKNDCSNWFGKGTGSAADIMSHVPIWLVTSKGPLPGFDAQTSDSPVSPIEVNSKGRFYPDSDNQLPVGDVYAPGSDGARMVILLHELAHKLDLIPHDGLDPAQSDKNTQTVITHCAKAIDGKR